MDKEKEKEVGHCSTGKLSVSPAPRPKAPKVLPPTISCPLPILLPMHCPSRMFTKKHEAGHFQFSPVYEIGQLQNWKVAKWREGQVFPQLVCLHPVCILGQILHFCSSHLSFKHSIAQVTSLCLAPFRKIRIRYFQLQIRTAQIKKKS